MPVCTVLAAPEHPFTWTDVVAPTPEELVEVSRRWSLHESSVADCLDPEHLPKHEVFPEHVFTILRAADPAANGECTTVQELTRKVAAFVGRDYIVTIHRAPQPYLERLMARWARGDALPGHTPAHAWFDLVNSAMDSYVAPLEQAERALDGFEDFVFEHEQGGISLRDAYLLKRRLTLYKRLLFQTQGLVTKVAPLAGPELAPLVQEARDNADSMHFWADELLDSLTQLLNVQLSLASHRTNEVVRLLTVFSAFFLPLTFIVGIYGMNFEHMPELRHPLGYAAVWVVMLAVTGGIWLWFRRRGWLRQ